MNLIPQWEQLFSPRVLARGYAYYLEGNVFDLQADEIGWSATVFGSEEYTVFVPNSAHDELEARCDCPYYDGGDFCKHLAATCYEIEQHLRDGEDFDETPATTASNSSQPSLEDLVRTIPEADARNFLLQALNESEPVRRRFISTFAEPDLKTLTFELESSIDRAVRSFGCHGFIDYQDAFSFSLELTDIIRTSIDPLLLRQAFKEVFELTTLVLLKLQDIRIDDSDGFSTDMMELCEDYWRSIVQNSDIETKHHVFNWLIEFTRQNPGQDDAEIYSYEQDCVEEFIIDAFATEPAFAQDIQDVADSAIVECEARLQGALETQPHFADGYRFDLERWTVVRLRTMRALGASDADLHTYAAPFMKCRNVRAFFVDDALTRGDIRRAIALLEEVKATTPGYLPVDDSKQLLALYEQIGDDTSAKQELFNLAVHDTRSYGTQELRWFQQLREKSNPLEWPTLRENILSSMNNSRTMRVYLADEGLTERLKTSIEALDSHERFSEVQRFTNVLETTHSQWLLAEYRSAVEEQLRRPSSRKIYQDAVGKILRMQRIPGGETVVHDMAKSLRMRYSRRPALIEELRALGLDSC